MRRIGTFNDSGKLRITHAGFHPGCTDRTRTNADFDDIRARENQLFHHFARYHVTGTDGFSREGFTGALQKINKMLRVTVGHVDADKLQIV